ncbi:MAG: DUF58 domain-containing protein [Bacteroidetes bacterium 4572_117]|nr:MAG: DUF58 domain-containing protein [Bacteroidetes bacterium 4572_117]
MKNTLDIQNFQQFDNLEFLANQVVEGFITGLHKSPFHGFSVEFAEHRLYNKGETTRHIDWKLFARTDRLYVKKYEEETNLRCQIIIDTSSSMLFPFTEKFPKNKLSFSVIIASALIYLLRKQRDAVGLTLFSDKIELQTDAKLSTVHSKRMYAELGKLLQRENYHLKKNTSVTSVLHDVAELIHKRSLVIIFSDMIAQEDPEKVFSALQHLRYNKHEVILFYVVDKKHELELKYENRPHKFVDLESGKTIKLNPNDVRQLYQKQSMAYFEELKVKCGQYNIDFVEADINSDFRDVLSSYLIKRKKLY